MLEILLLIFLCKRLGAMLRNKGRSAGWMQFLLVVCWFGGEIIGAVAMVVFTQSGGGGFDAVAYFGALLGAAGGATIVFVIAHHLAPLNQYTSYSAFEVVQPGAAAGRPPTPPI